MSATTPDSITWTWNAVEGAIGYVVQVSTDETFDDTDPSFQTAETTFTVSPLPPGTRVHVRVAAAGGPPAAPVLSGWTPHVTGILASDLFTVLSVSGGALTTSSPETAYGSRYRTMEFEFDAVNASNPHYLVVCVRSPDFRPDIRFSTSGSMDGPFDVGGFSEPASTHMTRIYGPVPISPYWVRIESYIGDRARTGAYSVEVIWAGVYPVAPSYPGRTLEHYGFSPECARDVQSLAAQSGH